LNAAHVALAAIHAQRETFRDEDSVRVHPILTKGGSLVNVVPDDVRLETYARGKTAEAIRDASVKVDRALRAGAVAVGCRVRIQTVPGYLPLRNDPSLAALFKANMLQFIAADDFVEGGHFGASTDMGDISHLLPALHPMIGGARGALHGADYAVADPVHSYLHSAKTLAMSVVDLLTEDAREVRRIVAGFRPKMSAADYLAYLRALSAVEEFDGASVGRGSEGRP
jgi:metal-dependent amidase/aminoacylase/carboxypeptidase family protein